MRIDDNIYDGTEPNDARRRPSSHKRIVKKADLKYTLCYTIIHLYKNNGVKSIVSDYYVILFFNINNDASTYSF